MSVAEKFSLFCDNLRIESSTISTISTRYKRITNCLNLDFRGIQSDTKNSLYVGSYGRGTAINGLSDLDMIFTLPDNFYSQYNDHNYNGQSALLQAIRGSIYNTYPSTHVGSDGQVVIVDFSDNISFEIVPVFLTSDGSFIYPDSNNGGSWKMTNPKPEQDAINHIDKTYNYNLKKLCKMARAWKNHWSVPIGGLLIDTLASDFLISWEHHNNSYSYYDLITRDFFLFLSNLNPDQSYWYAIGSNQHVYSQGKFDFKAKRCYNITLEAMYFEDKNNEWSANKNWREIYGYQFPN